MEHFSEQVWVDYVRGSGTALTMQELQGHLVAGCRECNSAFEIWRGVESFAVNESKYAPPENFVRMVKLEFSLNEAVQPDDSVLASLMFDSTTVPLPVGVRSVAAVSTRQFVYEGEGLTIDLRFERQPNSKTMSAFGQVLDQEVPMCWLGNTRVVLWTDKGRMLSTSDANDFGEFHLEFEPQGQLCISIATTGRRTLRIPLGNLG